MTKEKAIPFTTEMVKAILEGQKTQTRRLIKPQPESVLSQIEGTDNLWTYTLCDTEWKCPYQVGQKLWVKEAWQRLQTWLERGEEFFDIAKDDTPSYRCFVEYRATNKSHWTGPWKSPHFMFKKFARLWIEITHIHVERLQDISIEDCQAEGVTYDNTMSDIWDSINAKRGYPWESNPLVWVYTFTLFDK